MTLTQVKVAKTNVEQIISKETTIIEPERILLNLTGILIIIFSIYIYKKINHKYAI